MLNFKHYYHNKYFIQLIILILVSSELNQNAIFSSSFSNYLKKGN